MLYGLVSFYFTGCFKTSFTLSSCSNSPANCSDIIVSPPNQPPFYCKDQYKMFNNVLHKPVKLHPNTSAPAKDLIMGVSLVIRTLSLLSFSPLPFSLEERVVPWGSPLIVLCLLNETAFAEKSFFNRPNRSYLIHFSFSLSPQLLQKNKEDRLGSTNDAEEIKSHEFFRSINWVDLENKRIKPPFNPNVVSSLSLSGF